MHRLTAAKGHTPDGLFMHFPSLPSFSLLILLALAATNLSRAQLSAETPAVGQPPSAADSAPIRSPEDLAREKAIAEFTQRMKDANYPALFEKAASEFGVPTDVLAGIAFAETRWEHLQWPPGETVSPETGMPRPYGIMSLWDNEYFGHSLLDAAKLIGKDPQELKDDPYQNMRGAAALLKQLYSETPKPADAQGDEIESWRKAIVKYSGIPQPELSEQHGLEVYEYMNDGYHQYGIEWEKHPVKLEAMRAEVAKIKADAQALALAREKEQQEKDAKLIPALAKKNVNNEAPKAQSGAAVQVAASTPSTKPSWMIWGAALGILALVVVIYFALRPKDISSRK
nr:transglycosylase SLT domain-containing protein [Pedosphaera parvula]